MDKKNSGSSKPDPKNTKENHRPLFTPRPVPATVSKEPNRFRTNGAGNIGNQPNGFKNPSPTDKVNANEEYLAIWKKHATQMICEWFEDNMPDFDAKKFALIADQDKKLPTNPKVPGHLLAQKLENEFKKFLKTVEEAMDEGLPPGIVTNILSTADGKPYAVSSALYFNLCSRALILQDDFRTAIEFLERSLKQNAQPFSERERGWRFYCYQLSTAHIQKQLNQLLSPPVDDNAFIVNGAANGELVANGAHGPANGVDQAGGETQQNQQEPKAINNDTFLIQGEQNVPEDEQPELLEDIEENLASMSLLESDNTKKNGTVEPGDNTSATGLNGDVKQTENNLLSQDENINNSTLDRSSSFNAAFFTPSATPRNPSNSHKSAVKHRETAESQVARHDGLGSVIKFKVIEPRSSRKADAPSSDIVTPVRRSARLYDERDHLPEWFHEHGTLLDNMDETVRACFRPNPALGARIEEEDE